MSGCTTTNTGTATPTVTPATTATAAPTTSAGSATPTVTATPEATAIATTTPASTTPDTTPKTYSGTGEKTLGPLQLNAGSATFHIKCANAGNSAFYVEFQDLNGHNLPSVGKFGSLYNNVKAGSPIENNIDVTNTYAIPAAGNYLIHVSCNDVAQWELSVSQ